MPGSFEVSVGSHFSAAHALRGYAGDCANLHGHNWTVRVTIRCRNLDEAGIGIDFRVVKEHLKAALEGLDHTNLNELPAFREANPSSENIARHLYGELCRRIDTDRVTVTKVGISETSDSTACYWEV